MGGKCQVCVFLFLHTLLNDCFSSNVCDREHGIKYVTEKEENTAVSNLSLRISLSVPPIHSHTNASQNNIPQNHTNSCHCTPTAVYSTHLKELSVGPPDVFILCTAYKQGAVNHENFGISTPAVRSNKMHSTSPPLSLYAPALLKFSLTGNYVRLFFYPLLG